MNLENNKNPIYSQDSQIESTFNVKTPIWLAMAEASKLGGIKPKTIRRAIQAKALRYKISGNRYLIDLGSLINFVNSKTKLKNKFNQIGLGQYIERWKM